MTYSVDIVLRGQNEAYTRQIVHDGGEPAAWTDGDVRQVLEAMLLAIDGVQNPTRASEPAITLRGFSWIVNPFDDGVVIALEISSGVAVAGPFAVAERELTDRIARVVAAASPPTRVH